MSLCRNRVNLVECFPHILCHFGDDVSESFCRPPSKLTRELHSPKIELNKSQVFAKISLSCFREIFKLYKVVNAF